jgi:hypothetical protein
LKLINHPSILGLATAVEVVLGVSKKKWRNVAAIALLLDMHLF